MDVTSFVAKYGESAVAGLGAALAAVVVMCATPPRHAREWTVGLISTLMGSIAGGAYVIERYSLQSWASSTTGLMAMLGVVFACGLPAWAVVRWIFTYIQRRRDKDLAEIATEVRDVIR